MSIEELKQELEKLGVKVHHRWGEARLQEELAKAQAAAGEGTAHVVTDEDLKNNPGLDEHVQAGETVVIPPADEEEKEKSDKVPRIMACNVSHDGVLYSKDEVVKLTLELEASFDAQGFLVK